MKCERVSEPMSRVLIKNKVVETHKLNRSFFSLFLTAILCIGTAQADGYMNCWVEPTPDSLKVFPQFLGDMGSTVFYWGYRSKDGEGKKGMFTSVGNKELEFSEDPSTPYTITVEANHNGKNNETWTLRRENNLKTKAWGGANIIWKLKILSHDKNALSSEMKLICEEISGTPKFNNLI